MYISGRSGYSYYYLPLIAQDLVFSYCAVEERDIAVPLNLSHDTKCRKL